MSDQQPNGRRQSNALADLFETLPPANRLEAEDELRAAGRDPEAIGHEFATLAATRLGIGRQAQRLRPPRRFVMLYPLAASVVLCLAGWFFLRERVETPPVPLGPRFQTTPALKWHPGRELAAVDAENPPAAQPTLAATPEIATAPPPASDPYANQPYVEEPQPPAVASLIDAGTATTAANTNGLIMPGVTAAMHYGMVLHTVPPRHITPPDAYRAATRQYSAQVRLAADGSTLENYVAGLPFPRINPQDPRAALKIMWNVTHNFVATDDLDIRNVAVDSGKIGINGQGMIMERHITIDHIRRLSYTGRLYIMPHPALPNPDQVLAREQIGPLLAPYDLVGVGMVTNRYLSPERQDDTWLYLPSLRRVRRLSASQRSDGLFGQDIDPDSTFGFDAQLAGTEWRLQGERDIVACMHAQHDPARWGTQDADFAFDDVWETRHVYVVEATSKLPAYAYGKRLLYIDKDTWTIPYADIYDRNGQLWKTWFSMSRPRPAADGGETLVTPAAVMLDLQLRHVTRAALSNASDVDWRVNQGEADGLKEEQFTITSLIEAGH